MYFRLTGLFSAFALLLLTACGNSEQHDASTAAPQGPGIREEAVNLRSGGTTLHSFLYFDSSKTGRRPAVIVVPEWWGLNDYARGRARQLAGLGYAAIALDMYGDGRIAADPKQAQELAMPFYTNPALFTERLEAAATYLKSRTETDTARLGAMGYCFGGSAVLQGARAGMPFRGVVSFHGDYPEPGQPWAKDAYKGAVLICQGAADSFVPMEKYEAFRKRLDSLGIRHTDKVYPDATHAFTNPAATPTGQKFNMPIRYNGAADTASWNDMKAFWNEVFR
ncbi:dienelactone hydrolase family protein [Flaviaesturariibacter flavus]|uniref:Dienelactone hydrolase family protein n=1 Tax=Flaviaesturariibacter flavus TaxID=2502780 RepID=A0A4R1BNC8_9BACT|nr:dienelactone hydrolase family protein [Flaviaesturariibacter flavus]TCJ19110.1 dienelactone hydrolase family protein [Flaviaesturariibacter flavus]